MNEFNDIIIAEIMRTALQKNNKAKRMINVYFSGDIDCIMIKIYQHATDEQTIAEHTEYAFMFDTEQLKNMLRHLKELED